MRRRLRLLRRVGAADVKTGLVLAAVLAAISHAGCLPRCSPACFFAPADFLQDARESVVAGLSANAAKERSPAQAAQIWFNLGVAQEARGSKDAAAQSYRQALELVPEHHLSNFNLALLLAQRSETGADVDEAEALLRKACATQRNPGALWNLGLVLVRQRASTEAVQCMEDALDAAAELGRTSRHLAMSLPLDERGCEAYFAGLREELSDFKTFCSSAPNLQGELAPLQQQLPAALEDIRRLPSDRSWLVSWASETARLFGASARAAAYGETLLKAWEEVVFAEPPALEKLLQSGQSSATVMGSAHGYHCLFFRAIGLPCVGYDLLEESMIGAGKSVLDRHGISEADVDFKVGDARTAPLALKSGSPSFLWLNDLVWPEDARKLVLQRAATELLPSSLVVSYGPLENIPKELRMLQQLRVATSWSPDSGEQITLLQRL
mmetsp:Transcript_51480/g.122428  ORF Transcript_51480/g.122428 Transcript_51480/m.122428 type:complete len:439 (+) Transcript_51480:115-1431(+)